MAPQSLQRQQDASLAPARGAEAAVRPAAPARPASQERAWLERAARRMVLHPSARLRP